MAPLWAILASNMLAVSVYGASAASPVSAVPAEPAVAKKAPAPAAHAGSEDTATAQSEQDAPDLFAIDPDRYQRITVPVTIDGKGPFRFLVDTGAQATVVTHRVIDQLQLQPTGRAMLIAMGSAQMVDTIRLDDLEFANRSFSGITAPLLKGTNVGADGIIGLDSLQNLKVIIDFLEDRISVSDAPLPQGSSSRYEIVVRARRQLGQMIITDARVDGVRTAIIIDTGSEHSFGNEALRRKLRARHKNQFVSLDVNGVSLLSDLMLVRDIKIGGLIMTNVPLGFHESPAFGALNLSGKPALILGMRNLRSFDRVAIDFSSRKVLFDLPPGSATNPVRTLFSSSRLGSS